MEIINVKNLKKSFGSLEIIKDVSFSVVKGEVLSIIGPSGSGKSTMLRCISQLEEVTDGTIEICGETLVKNGVYVDKKSRHEITLKSGLVFQNFNLFPHYSVIENIMKPQMLVLKKSEDDAREVAISLLKRMDLEQKANNYPCELSGGQQQRVSIARALALKPEVLLFDEPTSALDPLAELALFSRLADIADGRTTLFISHRLSSTKFCDRILVLSDGKISEIGSHDTLMEKDGIYADLFHTQAKYYESAEVKA